MKKEVLKDSKIIWNFLRIKDRLVASEAIFILGGSSLLPVKKASELYKKGLSKNIVFYSIGGTFSNQKWRSSEAKTYYNKLIALGIPKKAIIWDELTSNTLEEARMSIKFMKKNGINPKKVILIDRPVHQRRAYATFVKQNPKIEFINAPSNEKFIPTENLIERMLAEMDRLKIYSKKGDLAPQKLSKEVKSALNNLI